MTDNLRDRIIAAMLSEDDVAKMADAVIKELGLEAEDGEMQLLPRTITRLPILRMGMQRMTGMRSAQAPGFIRGVSASTTCRSDQYNGSQYQSGPGGATNTGILGLTNRKGLANGECYADRSPVQLSDLPHCWPASLVGESVRVRAGGVQRLHSGEAGSLRCRGQDQRQRRTEAGHHCGEENTGTCLAVGIVQCCPTAGNTRRDVGILQLLQVDYRQAQGPQGGCAQVSVPQGQPTVDSVYPQWVQPAIQREAVCGEDRGTESRLVAESPVRTVIGDDHQRRCRSLLRIVCGATGRPATTRVGHRDWDRPGTDHVRSVVERQDHRIAEVLPTRRTAAEEGATGFVPQGQGQQEQGQATHQGCEGSRQGAGHPAGLGAQALDADHPREPSGVRRGLVRCRPGAYPHGEVGPRCRVVTVHPHVGGEGQPFWPNLRAGGSVVPVIANVQCVRCGGREEGTQRQGVDVPVRYNPRPGFERGQERTRGGTRRESKRLRRAGKSPRLAGSVAL